MRSSQHRLLIFVSGLLFCLPLLAFVVPPADFSGTYILQPENKKNPAANMQLTVTQSDSSIRIVSSTNGQSSTETFPLDGSQVPYITETGATGKGSAQWHGKELLVQTIVAGKLPSGVQVHFLTKEEWKLSSDGKTLKVHTDVSSPETPSDIMSVVAPSDNSTYKRVDYP